MASVARLDGESVLDYQIRLCTNMDELGLNWRTVAALINAEDGSDKSADHYRHTWYGLKTGIEYERSRQLDGDELAREYENRRVDAAKEKVRLQDQKREYAAMVRNVARFEHIRDELMRGMESLKRDKPIQWSPVARTWNNNKHAVLMLSDAHYGMTIDTTFNKYNPAIFIQRLDKLQQEVIDACREQQIQTLHIMRLGDDVAGTIHVSTRIHSTENVIKQTQRVAEAYSEFTARLSDRIPFINVYGTVGNHGRVSANKEAQREGENFEHFIPWWMTERLRDVSNVQVMENTYHPEIIVADVLGNKVVGVHGDKDNPVNSVSTLAMMLGFIPSQVLMGHYHHNWEKGDVIVNESFCGADQYSIDKRLASKPAQKLLVYTPNGIKCEYKIDLR